MLESFDLKARMDKTTYKSHIDKLTLTLGALQRQAREAQLPIAIVLEGWDAAGKGDTIAQIATGLDPRGFAFHRIGAPNEEEGLNPFLRRFWLRTPARGRIAVFDSSWYRRVIFEPMDGQCSAAEAQTALAEINEFERQLVDGGTLVIKFWLHISQKEQDRRFRKCRKDPHSAWRLGKVERRRHARYDDMAEIVNEVLERTSTSYAPWTVVEATDKRYRRVKVLQTICQTISGVLTARSVPPAQPSAAPLPAEPIVRDTLDVPNVLDRVDLGVTLSPTEYERQLKPLQGQLRELEFKCFLKRLGVVIGFEGWDAAGKGGCIRRLTERLDPRGYTVVPVAAPAGEESTHHYLWRFWRSIPKAGHLAIFDRTWYGRVLVERVEGFCSPSDWHRSYQEINEFERSLTNAGWVVVKFWLHISPEEQLRRFELRKNDPNKQYKLTDEDWRNRAKWGVYQQAVVDMIQRTSTTYAPWTIVESNCKHHARIKTLHTVISAIERGLKRCEQD